jgi:hypothetical protein
MPGTKTSVWLGEEQYAQWKASGDSLTEIVKRGLAVGSPDEALNDKLAPLLERVAELPDEGAVRRIVREELERVAGQSHA